MKSVYESSYVAYYKNMLNDVHVLKSMHVACKAKRISYISCMFVVNLGHFIFYIIDHFNIHHTSWGHFNLVANLRGYCTSYPKKLKISLFCALSENYQHLFEK